MNDSRLISVAPAPEAPLRDPVRVRVDATGPLLVAHVEQAAHGKLKVRSVLLHSRDRVAAGQVIAC